MISGACTAITPGLPGPRVASATGALLAVPPGAVGVGIGVDDAKGSCANTTAPTRAAEIASAITLVCKPRGRATTRLIAARLSAEATKLESFPLMRESSGSECKLHPRRGGQGNTLDNLAPKITNGLSIRTIWQARRRAAKRVAAFPKRRRGLAAGRRIKD